MVFSWIKGAAKRKFAAMQRTELIQFIEMLDGADDETIGLVVALATNLRHDLAAECDLSDPTLIDDTEVLALELVRIYQQLQKQGMEAIAPGVAVWLHTVRAVHTPENRSLARKIWGGLSRGFPYVIDAAYEFELLGGEKLALEGYNKFPIGFEPKN